VLNGPIITYPQQEAFAKLRRAGVRLVGMSSYLRFPVSEEGDPFDYEAACEAWCHCFRDPDQFLGSAIPRLLLSASDFTDCRRVARDAVGSPESESFDFIYVGGVESWERARKNWRLAGECIPLICRDLGLRCLVIGAPSEEFPPSSGVTFSLPLPWADLLSHLARARFLFAPNQLDASPRILSEALCLDVPILVNRGILGGWKYVNRFTGTFFEGRSDVIRAVSRCLNQPVAPRHWFCANHGPYVSGARLHRLLKTLDPDLKGDSPLWLAERCDELAPSLSH
jgi:hypothetical protein